MPDNPFAKALDDITERACLKRNLIPEAAAKKMERPKNQIGDNPELRAALESLIR